MSVSFSEAEPVNLWCRWRPLSCSFGAERFSDPGNMLRKCCMNMSPAEKHEEDYLRFLYKGLNRWPIRRECAYREAGLKGTWAPRIVWGWGWTRGVTYGAAVRWTSCSNNRNITSPIVSSQNNDRDFGLNCHKPAADWPSRWMNLTSPKKPSNIWALLWTLFLSVNTDVSPPGSCHRRFSGWCWLVSLDEPAGCRWRSKQLRGWHARAVSLVPERLKEGALGRDCARRPPCRYGVRSGPGRPAAWRPASSSAGLVPGGGPPARSSELENKQSRVRANTRRLSPEQSGRNFWAR